MALSVVSLCRTLPIHIRGGMEEASWNLARALARAGAQVTVLTTSVDHTPREWTADGVAVHELAYVPRRLRGKARYRWWPHFARAAHAYARGAGLKPDVVHSQSLYAAGFLRDRPRPPVVATVHGTPMGDYLGGSRDKLVQEVGRWHPRVLLQYGAVRLADRRAARELRGLDAIVAGSAVVAATLPGVRPGDPRVVLIPNGIDATQFPWIPREQAREALGLPRESRILLFLGRVEEYKGVGRLVDVLGRFPDARLVVAGEGGYLAALRERLRHDAAADRVRLLGPIDDAQRPLAYAAADLLCLPSRIEGQPVTLLEAMAMGTPVMTTRPWLPAELLPYASVGEDVEAAVAGGLALSARTDRRVVREAVLDAFTWDQVARRYLDLFGRLRESRAG